MKTKFTAEQLEQISKIQERDNLSRKSAVKKYSRLLKANKVPDFKAAAANDTDSRPVIRRKPKTATKSTAPTTEAGSARAEGLRLYKLAGRPKKNDFVHVYGKPGVAATWERRAVMVGLGSAEEAAEKFQKMLRQPAGACLVKEESKPAKGAAA